MRVVLPSGKGQRRRLRASITDKPPDDSGMPGPENLIGVHRLHIRAVFGKQLHQVEVAVAHRP